MHYEHFLVSNLENNYIQSNLKQNLYRIPINAKNETASGIIDTRSNHVTKHTVKIQC